MSDLANGTPAAIFLAGRPAICGYALVSSGVPSAELTARTRRVMTDLQPAANRTDDAGWPIVADLPR